MFKGRIYSICDSEDDIMLSKRSRILETTRVWLPKSADQLYVWHDGTSVAHNGFVLDQVGAAALGTILNISDLSDITLSRNIQINSNIEGNYE